MSSSYYYAKKTNHRDMAVAFMTAKYSIIATATFSTVSHAPLRGLQVVDHELAAVPHSDGDAEQAAVFGAAVEELPGGAGGELADVAGPRQGGVLQ